MSARTRAELLLFAVTFIWGSTFVATKFLLASVSPFLYSTIRFGLATVVLGVIFLSRLRQMSRRTLLHGLILGSLLFVGFSLQTIGLQFTSASKSAFFTGMLVVFTPLCQFAIERRAPKIGNVLGVVLVTVGLFLLTSPKGAEFNLGDGLTLGCAFLFGLYIVYLDVFTKQSDSLQLTFIQFATSALFGGLVLVLLEQPVWNYAPSVLAVLGYMIVFATLIAMYVQTRFQKDTTPTRSAIIFSSEPVIAAGFAYLVLEERLGLLGIGGALLILSGVLVSELSEVVFRSNSKPPH